MTILPSLAAKLQAFSMPWQQNCKHFQCLGIKDARVGFANLELKIFVVSTNFKV
jgi:hypothetical protein